MFKCRIADLTIEIHNVYPYVYEKCKDYLCRDEQNIDMVVSVTNEEIEQEGAGAGVRKEVLEFLAVYRKICGRLAAFNGFLIHGVALDVCGEGYIFCAPSGTGKTTHTGYWAELLGDSLTVINGDKPIVRLHDGVPTVYGTPWCGKEGLNKNASVALCNLCFIHRSEENETKEIDTDSAFTQLLSQIQLPDTPEDMIALMEMVDIFLSRCKKYDIFCNMSVEAASIAYNTITKGDKK